MDDLHVNLPESEAQFVRERAAEEGIDSGPGIEVTPEYWERKKRELRERLGVAAE